VELFGYRVLTVWESYRILIALQVIPWVGSGSYKVLIVLQAIAWVEFCFPWDLYTERIAYYGAMQEKKLKVQLFLHHQKEHAKKLGVGKRKL